MNDVIFSIYRDVKHYSCDECDVQGSACANCEVTRTLGNIEALEDYVSLPANAEGCYICKPKKGKMKDIFFDNGRGGLDISQYCPKCGRRIN